MQNNGPFPFRIAFEVNLHHERITKTGFQVLQFNRTRARSCQPLYRHPIVFRRLDFCCQLFRLAHIVVERDDLIHRRYLIFFARNADQWAGVPFGKMLRLIDKRFAHLRRKLQEAQRVCDSRAILADLFRNHLLRHAELLDQSLIGQRLFDRIEVGALNILDEGQLEHLLRGYFLDNHRHSRQAGQPCRSPAPLPAIIWYSSACAFPEDAASGSPWPGHDHTSLLAAAWLSRRVTMIGWSRPCSLIDALKSSRRGSSSRKARRGWRGLGIMLSIGTWGSDSSSPLISDAPGRRASRPCPRPNFLLVTSHYLLSQRPIGQRPGRRGIIVKDGLPKTGGLA